MSDQAFDELAHAVLDGIATPQQRATLDARLASDSIVRERWIHLEVAFMNLARIRAVEPPLDLKPAIMRAVHAERQSAVREIEARPLRVALTTGTIELEFAGEMRCSVLLKGAQTAKRPMRVTLRSGGMASIGELNRR